MLVSNIHRSAVSACFRSGFIHPQSMFLCISDCGDLISHGSTNVSLSDCSFQCTGDSSETCGAGNRLNLYWSGATPPPPPEVVPSVGLWESLGCYTYVNHFPFSGARPVTNLLVSQTAMVHPEFSAWEQPSAAVLPTTALRVVLMPASPRVTPLREWNIPTSVVC